jgi:hypothetical protein
MKTKNGIIYDEGPCIAFIAAILAKSCIFINIGDQRRENRKGI